MVAEVDVAAVERQAAPAEGAVVTRECDAPVLQVKGLRKAFGAVKATDGVDLTLARGEIHALIGPNGAGKSTLISQLSGELRPDHGSIRIDGDEVTAQPAWARARRGLSRSFQITELCPDYSALENVMLSLILVSGRAYRAWTNPRRDAALIEHARQRLDDVGLGHRADIRVSGLAHGEKRQLELAVALAREPRILLLDEPMAGMGAEETARMTAQLLALKGRYSILLVEHDMQAVFALADRITVLVYGRTIFTGTPAEVRSHPDVKAAYLGEDTVGQDTVGQDTVGVIADSEDTDGAGTVRQDSGGDGTVGRSGATGDSPVGTVPARPAGEG